MNKPALINGLLIVLTPILIWFFVAITGLDETKDISVDSGSIVELFQNLPPITGDTLRECDFDNMFIVNYFHYNSMKIEYRYSSDESVSYLDFYGFDSENSICVTINSEGETSSNLSTLEKGIVLYFIRAKPYKHYKWYKYLIVFLSL